MTKYETFSLFISALSAVGTIAAVFSAIYLATIQNRVKVLGKAGKRLMIYSDGSKPIETLSVQITNRSNRTIKIVTVGWIIGKGKNSVNMVQTFNNLVTGKQLPVLIEPGNDIIQSTKWIDHVNGMSYFKDQKDVINKAIRKKQVYLTIFTTLKDNPYMFKAEQAVIESFKIVG